MTDSENFQVVLNNTTPADWDVWLAMQETDTVFQSWNWKTIQEAAGRAVQTARVINSAGECVAQTLLITTTQVFGMPILLSPRGPVIADTIRAASDAPTVMQQVLDTLVTAVIVHFPDALCWRFEPALEIGATVDSSAYWPAIPGRRVDDVQPAWTRLVLLNWETPDTLLAQMKQKTRYNIRLAKKKGVVVTQLFREQCTPQQWEQALEQWIRLQDQTAQRHGIRHHGAAYYRALFMAEWSSQFVSVLQAEYNGQVLAMNVLLWDAASFRSTYLFGASSGEYPEVMAPYALQWAALQWSLEQRLAWYDLYGIAPLNAANDHPLATVSRFKAGLGGRVVHYPGTFDFPIRRFWYRIYRLLKQWR